jgi:hypothetical protein
MITKTYPIDYGDLEELIEKDGYEGYSDTLEEVLDELEDLYGVEFFLSNAYCSQNGQKIILEFNEC